MEYVISLIKQQLLQIEFGNYYRSTLSANQQIGL